MPAKVHRAPSLFHILVLFFFVITALFPNGRPVEAQSPVPIVAISAGLGHTTAIRADGTLITLSGAPTVSTPAPGTFTQVSAGTIHDCGIRTDGTLACWGYNDDGRATPPDGTFTQVSSSDGNCAISTGGSLVCWGPDPFGALSPSLEALTHPYTQVSVGSLHSCGITADEGELRCWGNNDYGKATPPSGDFIKVDVDTHSSCGIRVDGTLACWGYAIGPGTVPEGTFTQVAVRYGEDACALSTDGTLACWGPDTYYNGFVPPAGTFVQITAGADHTCALKADGTGTCWGRHDFGHEGGPFPPMDVTISSPSESAFALAWTDISIDEVEFRVDRSMEGEYWTRLATLGPNSTGYLDPGLTPDTTYYYRVQACRNVFDGDCSTFSNIVSSTTPVEGPLPNFAVRLAEKEIHGYQWPLGGTVTLDIDDPGTPQSTDYHVTEQTGAADWNPEDTFTRFTLEDFTLRPGQTVTMTNGHFTKVHQVVDVTISTIDTEDDTITGTAPAYSRVEVGHLCDEAGCAIRRAAADENGDWTVNFAQPGADPDEQDPFDIRPGTQNEVRVADDDGDTTNLSWRVPFTRISAKLSYNEVQGYEWPEDVLVTLTIEDLSTEESPDYTASATPKFESWQQDTFVQFRLEGAYQLKPGDLVTMTNDTITKTLEVQGLVVTGTNADQDTVSGTAPAGVTVEVGHLCGGNGCAIRRVPVANDGTWVANFGIQGQGSSWDEKILFDILPGTEQEARILDDDGDASARWWRVPNPNVTARMNQNQVEGFEWTLETGVTMTLDDPDTGLTPDISLTKTVGVAPWDPTETYIDFQLGDFHLEPGQVIEMTDGTSTKQLTLESLAITDIDVEADTVSGTAPAGSMVHVGRLCEGDQGCAMRHVQAVGGVWMADFGTPVPGATDPDEKATFNIHDGTGSEVFVSDTDADRTVIDWQIRLPSFSARLVENEVQGYQWPLGGMVDLEIEDSTTALSPDVRMTAQTVTADWNPNETFTRFSLEDFTLQPGQTVTMTNGQVTRTLEIADVSITAVDTDTDTLTGTAPAGSRVEVGHVCDETGCAIRRATASESGEWTVNFAQPGADPDEQDPFDIRPGTQNEVRVADDDGDTTNLSWRVLNPSFSARLSENEVHGYEWPLDLPVTLTIDDPLTAGTDFAPDPQLPVVADWDPNNTFTQFFLDEYQLKTNDVVTLTNGDITKTHTVRYLETTSINSDAETVSGLATPGAVVGVGDVCDDNGCAYRDAVAGPEGVWVADFSEPGSGPNEKSQNLFNLRPGISGEAFLADEDGDWTSAGWRVPDLPVIVAFPDWDSVGGDDWPMGRDVTLTIDDSSTTGPDPLLQWTSQSYPRPWDPSGTWIDYQLDGYDLKTGDILAMTDGVTTKSVTVSGLRVTSIDDQVDLISGETDANLRVHVWIDNVPEWIERNIFTTDGSWQVDFSAPGGSNPSEEISFDIVPGSAGQAKDYDVDNDSTQVSWYLLRPAIVAYPLENSVVAEDWPVGSSVTLTIDDGSTPEPENFNRQALVEFNPNYGFGIARFDFPDFDLDGGDIVAVDGAGFSRTITVYDLTAVPNLQDDTITGYAGPGNAVFTWVNTPNGWTTRPVTADEDGIYVADFSVDEGRPDGFAIDITSGSSGEVAVGDMGAGGQTRVSWQVPNYSFHAVPAYPEVHGHDWPLGAVVTLTVDDDTDPNNGVLYTATKPVSFEDWCGGQPCFDLSGGVFDLQVGQYVTLTDGTITKTVLVSRLQVTEVDHVNDRITGIADPGSRVAVNIWSQDGTARYVEADADGNWVADFSILGDEDFEQSTADLVDGDFGRAVQLNPGGDNDDGTLEYWTVYAPPLCQVGDSITGTAVKTGTSRQADTDLFAPVKVYFLEAASGEQLFQTAVGEDGTYGCDLPAGTYTVYAVSDGYAKDYYSNADKETAAPVTVVDNQSVTGIDFNLDTPLAAYDHLDFNFTRPAVSELSVRQAIAYAINRELLISETFPYSPVPDSITPPNSPLYPENGLPEGDYNLAAAISLLESAGWVDTDGDGVREKGGTRLHLVLATTDAPVRHTLAERVQADLAEAGIEVETRFFDHNGLFGDALPNGDFDLTIFGWLFDTSDEYIGYQFRQFVPDTDSGNYGRYDSPAADVLLAQADSAGAYAERISYWQQHQVVLMNDLATLPLVWRVVVDTDLDGMSDLEDVCPGDPSNQCSPETSEAEIVAEDGGTLVTPDEQVVMDVPAGALEETTTLSITEMGGNFEIASYQGEMLTASSFSIEPHGTVFAQPVTITFTWADADNDGIVDGTGVLESNLLVIKNNMVITPACVVYSGCDMAANQISVEVTSLSLFVLGVPKIVDAGGPYTAVEGAPVSLSGLLTSGVASEYAWELDGDNDFDDAAGQTPEVVFAENGTYPISLRVTAEDGSYQVDSTEVRVANANPVVEAISAPLEPKPVGTAVTTDARFSDAGTGDTHTALWDWGDGTTSGVTVEEGGAAAPGSHVYTTPGVYVITLKVTDDDGGAGSSSFRYVVVYDPEGGFVTGGGWITSPVGAYATDPALAGKATFGFVSKYKKGANVPTGETEFQFKLAGLNFHSESYQWLVVAGAKAQFKGVGTINGAGTYGFMLTAVDGTLNDRADRFRIKIWDLETGDVVYDNQMGVEDTAEPATLIGGGSIVVHK